MAQTISISFSGEVNLGAKKFTYVSDLDTNGLVYAIGTDYNTTGFSNPATGSGADIRTYNDTGGGDTELVTSGITDRNLSVGGFVNVSSNGHYVRVQFPNHRLICTRVTCHNDGTGGPTITLYGVGDDGGTGGSLTTLASAVPVASAWDDWIPTNFQTAYKGFRLQHTAGGGSWFCDQIEIYGVFISDDGSSVGTVAPANVADRLQDEFLTGNGNGLMRYEDGLHLTNDRVYRSAEVTMTGDQTLGDLNQSVVLSMDPNGADRNIILPQNPFCGTYLKLISADGAFKLNIRETVGGAIQHELSTANNSLVATCIWNGTTWHITG